MNNLNKLENALLLKAVKEVGMSLYAFLKEQQTSVYKLSEEFFIYYYGSIPFTDKEQWILSRTSISPELTEWISSDKRRFSLSEILIVKGKIFDVCDNNEDMASQHYINLFKNYSVSEPIFLCNFTNTVVNQYIPFIFIEKYLKSTLLIINFDTAKLLFNRIIHYEKCYTDTQKLYIMEIAKQYFVNEFSSSVYHDRLTKSIELIEKNKLVIKNLEEEISGVYVKDYNMCKLFNSIKLNEFVHSLDYYFSLKDKYIKKYQQIEYLIGKYEKTISEYQALFKLCDEYSSIELTDPKKFKSVLNEIMNSKYIRIQE